MPNISHFNRAITWLRHLGIIRAVGFVLLVIIAEAIAYGTHPYIVSFFNTIGYRIDIIWKVGWNWIAPLLVVFIISLITSWQVRKAKEKAVEWVERCRRLNEQLNHYNKEKQWQRMGIQPADKQISLEARMNLDTTTPGDLLFNEATEALEKYDKKE